MNQKSESNKSWKGNCTCIPKTRKLKKPVRWEDYEKKAQGYGQYRIAHKRACSKMLRNPLRMIASNFSIDGESCKQYLNKNSGEKFDFLK